MTGTEKGTGPDGKPVKLKHVMEEKDDDTWIQKIFVVDKDGKELEVVTITYTRKEKEKR